MRTPGLRRPRVPLRSPDHSWQSLGRSRALFYASPDHSRHCSGRLRAISRAPLLPPTLTLPRPPLLQRFGHSAGKARTLPFPLARPLLPRHARTRGRVRLNGGPCSIRNDGLFAPRGLNGRQRDERRGNGTMDTGGVSAEAPLHIIGESDRHPTARECRNISAGTIRTGTMGRMQLHACSDHVCAGLHDRDCREITPTKSDQGRMRARRGKGAGSRTTAGCRTDYSRPRR